MKAVLVLDMIHEFVGGNLGSERVREMVPRLQAFLERTRAKGLPVFYACDAHRPGDPELQVWGEHAMQGTEAAQVVPELAPQEGDGVFAKQCYDALTNPKLADELRRGGVDTLVLTGTATHICVQNTAADAFFRGYDLVVPEDLVEAPTEEAHRQGLKYMEQMYGARIVGSGEAL